MKNRFLFFFITLFLASSVVTAQVSKYHPLADSGNVWSNAFEGSNCSGGDYDWGFDIYQALGDTIINNLTYRKIYQGSVMATSEVGYNYIGSITISPVYFYKGILLRDDTVNKQVLIRNGDTDELLYDFNLNVGDTLPDGAVTFKSEGFTIAFIDSIQLEDGTYRKQWGVIVNSDTAYFIEGIGFSGGLDIDVGGYFGAECSASELNCFSQQDTNLYQLETPPFLQAVYDSSHLIPCQVPTPTGIYNPNTVSAQLFPNPVTSGGSITIKGITEEYTFTLDNLLGQAVFSKEITSPSQPINLPNSITSGVYLCHIKTQSGLLFVKKIVVL